MNFEQFSEEVKIWRDAIERGRLAFMSGMDQVMAALEAEKARLKAECARVEAMAPRLQAVERVLVNLVRVASVMDEAELEAFAREYATRRQWNEDRVGAMVAAGLAELKAYVDAAPLEVRNGQR